MQLFTYLLKLKKNNCSHRCGGGVGADATADSSTDRLRVEKMTAIFDFASFPHSGLCSRTATRNLALPAVA